MRRRDQSASESWLARAGIETPVVGRVEPATSAAMVRTTESSSPGGWDPFDVWLRRVHEPRRRALARD